MELMDILNDAIRYPLKNLNALAIYLALGIIVGIALAGSMLAIAAGIEANNLLAVFSGGAIGGIITLIFGFVIAGYELDIIKYGITRSDEAPGVDLLRQFVNGVKLFVVYVVYLAVPIILVAILGLFIQDWVCMIVAVILSILFGLALMMAECRLSKTEDLVDALAIGEAIGDIGRIGIGKVLAFIILVIIIAIVISMFSSLVSEFNSTIGGILSGIIGVYLTFFISRAIGLLYSEI